MTVRIGATIYGMVSLVAYSTTLTSAFALIFDRTDAIDHRHVPSAARTFLIQDFILALLAVIVIVTFGLPAEGTSDRGTGSTITTFQATELSGLKEGANDEIWPVAAYE